MIAGPSSQNVTVKLVLFYLLLLIDIIASSFIEASFSLSASTNLPHNTTFIVLCLTTQPIQLVIVVGMIVMILIMVWQTFLLRYGLLGILFKEFLVSFLIVIFVTGNHRELFSA
jgi:hypothetical protein